jgi:hypothetical protein
MKILGEAVRGQAKWLHELGEEDLARMNRKSKRDPVHDCS